MGKKITLFSSEVSPSTLLPEGQLDVSQHLEELVPGAPQQSALHAVAQWAALLRETTPQESKESLRTYLDIMGYLPEDKRIVANAEKSRDRINEVLPRLLDHFTSTKWNPETFYDTPTDHLQTRYEELTASQIDLLKSILRHQARLDEADLRELVAQFPFPIMRFGFFGRFIAGGCDDPRKSIRYLRLCTPFFVRLRSMLEGISNDRYRFLVLKGIESAVDYEGEEDVGGAEETTSDPMADFAPPPVPQVAEGLSKDAVEMVRACIDHAHDFFGGVTDAVAVPFATIKVPDLPHVMTNHIDNKERVALAVEVMDWFLTGAKDGPLLNRQALSIEAERDYKKMKKELLVARKNRKKHRAESPDQDNRKAMSIWEREDDKIEREIEEFEKSIKLSDRARRKMRPILRQLEEIEIGKISIKRFRDEIADARAKGRKIVFTLLSKTTGMMVCQYLDRAFSSQDRTKEGMKILREAAFLLCPSAMDWIKQHRVRGFGSLAEQQLREFQFALNEMGASLKYILGRILPEKIDPKVGMLVDAIRAHIELPGVTERKHFTYLVKEWCGKRNPKPEQYLEYAFEHAAFFTEASLQSVLLVMRELGLSDIPPRCKELSAERFHHAPAILSQFQIYSESYKPNKLGELPAVFSDIATLDAYRSLHLDAFGMAKEIETLERHLIERGIVCIVDTTNFHPELGTVVAEEKIKDDVEKTQEVWGDYVRPHERLVRSFARRLMEGDACEELANYSLVAVARPGKLDKIWEKLIRKFLGIDISLTPDLGLINQVLSDLTLHDENIILVVDADCVKDLEQYRQFVGLLQRYHIKVILRMREPLPGLPQVLIQPFLDEDIADRLMAEESSLRRALSLEEPIPHGLFDFTAALVKRSRRPDEDNLNLVLHTLNAAAQHARMEGFRDLTEQDIAAAAPSIFHLPDGEQIRHRKTAVDKFIERAPLEVLGQHEAIRTIGSRMKSHVLGVRDIERPLTLLLPGPTGVGKTELMMKFALALNIPFFHVEGAQFSESHTVARLIGSPSGYVGPDKGILYTFAEENAVALVFFDEIEKMHPDVYTALMNYFDAAVLTAGNGETVRRPGHVIVGAANAGAERLHRNMSEREIKDVLSESFIDRHGNKRPELVRRFEAIPMLALEKEYFIEVLRANLHSLGKRFGFVNANLRLVGVDDSAVELLYDASQEVCAFEGLGGGRFGFGTVSVNGTRTCTPTQIAAQQELFFDMRHVSRAFEQLGGDSVRQFAEEQYERGWHRRRQHPRKVRIMGDPEHRRILLVDVAEGNGHG